MIENSREAKGLRIIQTEIKDDWKKKWANFLCFSFAFLCKE